MTHILTLNAGSSSLKFSVYDRGSGGEVLAGQVTHRSGQAVLVVKDEEHRASPDADDAFASVTGLLGERGFTQDISAVAHRVVHGGEAFAGPVRIDEEVLLRIRDLTRLAPLHQPAAIDGIERAEVAFPSAVQTASFDTSFHRTQSALAQLYALPRAYSERGVRRYGFHGLSYDYLASQLAEIFPRDRPVRAVLAHLGSGASLCALQDGKSVASTMGFSALDGLPMATRCGSLDPGVVLHLLRAEGLSPAEIEKMLYQRSGLLGLSDISGDLRELLDSDEPSARQAVDYFCHRIVLGIGEMAGAIGGIDALVFSAGVGENAASVRAQVAERLGYLGVVIDPSANRAHAREITAPGAHARSFVLPTDEAAILFRDADAILGGKVPPQAAAVRGPVRR